MGNITVVGLLDAYTQRVKRGEIQFLEKGSTSCGEVLDIIQLLLTRMKEAEAESRGLSETPNWYETHQVGRSLWEMLLGYALRDIDPVAKGNSELFKFAGAAADFEDLLYGMSRYYRDHTLHSLWVYLIGEHILRDLLPDVYKNLDWGVRSTYPRPLQGEAKRLERKLLDGANKHKDAAWCLTALCHDLGYSLAQLHRLNESVEKVLRFLDLPGFTRIGYSFEVEHQYLSSQFLELMAGMIWIVPSPDEKVALIKNFREAGDYWRLCRSLEKRQHGIYSSFLIYKLLDIFADIWVRDPAEPWGLDEEEAVDNLLRGNILFAIAQHEFEFAHLNMMGSLADILVLVDELEEFSRFGRRQLLERKYRDTMADVDVSFKSNGTARGRELDIDITYDVAEGWDPGRFYVTKAEMLCRKYSLDMQDDDSTRESQQYVIRNVNMVVRKGAKEVASFNLSSDPAKTGGHLPEAKIGKHPAARYRLLCHDDKVIVSTKDEEITLQEWFGVEIEAE